MAVHRLPNAVASLAAEQGSRHAGLSNCSSRALRPRLGSCGTEAELLRGMWHPPGSGVEAASPPLAAGFPTTEPRGSPFACFSVEFSGFLPWFVEVLSGSPL